MTAPSTPSAAPTKFSFQTALLASIPIVLAVAVLTYASIAKNVFSGLDTYPDSNLRLTQVRDWMAGQNWFDMTMARYGFEGGTAMHWTRLADLGPAGLLWFFSLFMSQDQSETAVSIVYPLLLLIPMGMALMWTTNRIVPLQPNVQIAIIVVAIIIQVETLWINFTPGNIDHHNLQIIAFIVFLGACTGIRDFRMGLLAGCAVIFGLIIGPDAAPAVIAAIIVVGCLWLIDPEREGKFVTGLGLAIAVCTLLGGLAFIPRPLSTTWCDSWTLPVGAIFFGLGTFLVGAAALGSRIQNRLLLVTITGAAGLAVLALLLVQFPSCRNPLPLNHPMLQRYWMALMWENLPFWEIFGLSPAVLANFAPVLVGVIAYVIAIRLKWLELIPTLPLFGALIASLALAALYTRGLPIAATAVIPVTAAVLAQALSSAPNVSRRILYWLIFAPVLSMISAGYVLKLVAPKESQVAAAPTTARSAYCMGRDELAKIKALPSGKIISPFGMTEFLLRHTDMQVSFAGYHRAYKENLKIMEWLIASPDAAKAAFDRYDIRYFSACTISAQFPLMARDYPNSFIAAAIGPRPPAWLTPVVTLQDNGILYRIEPAPKP